MVAAVVDAGETSRLVAQTGWDHEHLYAVENALAAERAGASAVAMRGRTRVQMYDGKADLGNPREVKKNWHAHSFTRNGDARSPEGAKRMIDISGRRWRHDWMCCLSEPLDDSPTVHYLGKQANCFQKIPFQRKLKLQLHLQRLVNLKAKRSQRKNSASLLFKGVPRLQTKVAINEGEFCQTVEALLDHLW